MSLRSVFLALFVLAVGVPATFAFRPEKLLGDLDPALGSVPAEGSQSPESAPSAPSPDPHAPAPSSTSAALAQAAHNAVGTSTANVPNTEGGNKACAWSVNHIAQKATGKPIGGGLSTRHMFTALANNPNAVRVPLSQVQPGDIVISPSGRATGHVGIMGVNGRVIENSSSRKMIREGRTMSQWTNAYGSRGLDTYVFRLM